MAWLNCGTPELHGPAARHDSQAPLEGDNCRTTALPGSPKVSGVRSAEERPPALGIGALPQCSACTPGNQLLAFFFFRGFGEESRRFPLRTSDTRMNSMALDPSEVP